MALENSQPQEVDLDRTDKLPILEGTIVAEDVEDDAVRLDYAPAEPSVKIASPKAASVDLPSRAEGSRSAERSRSAEDGMSRQNAEASALEQSYARARGVGAVKVAQAQDPAADFAGLRAMLESAQARARELERALAEKQAAADAARERFEDTLRDAERHESESRSLRSALATRDAAIAQVQHSLSERNAQLFSLQREHAQVVPALEERSKLGTQLEAELHALRARYESMAGDLNNAQQSVAALSSQLKAGKEELDSNRRELNVAQLQAASYLEHLRTREWRRGFDQTVAAEGDGAAQGDGSAQNEAGAQAERDRLRGRVVEIEAQLASRDEIIATLKAAAEHPSATEKALAELSAQVKQLQSEAQTREDENAVLLAHLQEARRPNESSDAEVKRLTEELAERTRALDQLSEDNRSLRVALEQARGSLEERDSQIHRLERSEAGANEAAPAECSAELVRIDDGLRNSVYPLSRRTRIGRAPGCEMQIESTSVSRHHALVIMSASEVIIEDLNSTNGVLVNGRRISRQLLNDGDLVTIGEAQFRLNLKLARRVETPPT